MTEIAKTQLADIGKKFLEEVKDDITSPEVGKLIVKVSNAVLAGATKLVEAASPGFAVPFEEMAFSWLRPQLQAIVQAEVDKLCPPNIDVSEAPVATVDDAAKVIANEGK